MSKFPAAPYELKGSLYPMTALRLSSIDIEAVGEALSRQVSEAPDFLGKAPIVLDLSRIEELPDVSALKQIVREAGLRPVGVSGTLEGIADAADSAGLPMVSSRERKERERPAAVAAAPVQQGTMVVKQTVRSGQQIYARGGDLVVLATVNRDAEVLADGHVHVYGSLKGKAAAGVQGDETARIFAQALDPQLLSVAGVYSSGEELKFDFHGQAGQVSLEGDALLIEPL